MAVAWCGVPHVRYARDRAREVSGAWLRAPLMIPPEDLWTTDIPKKRKKQPQRLFLVAESCCECVLLVYLPSSL